MLAFSLCLLHVSKGKMSFQHFHSYVPMMFSINISTFLIFIMNIIPFSYCAIGDRTCPGLFYNCGNLLGIGYPFWGGDRPNGCGINELQLQCVKNQYSVIVINNVQEFRVVEIDESLSRMTVAREDLWLDICLKPFTNTSLPNYGPLKYNYSTGENLNIFYNCPPEAIQNSKIPSNVTCSFDSKTVSGVLYAQPLVEGCNISIVAPVLTTSYNGLTAGKITLHQALKLGFDVEYGDVKAACSICEASGGSCGSNYEDHRVPCTCQNTTFAAFCPKGSPRFGKNRVAKLAIGASAAGIMIIICLVVILYCKIKKPSIGSLIAFRSKSKDNQNLEAFIKQNGSLGPRRYSYLEIKKMTNSFNDKLGKGGYGDVYKGNLFDNRPVAVKILNTSKGSGEEFINEVASISRTAHVNVVTLLGFCLDGEKRALIYEFMPNGSLEKYIHAETPPKTENDHLGWGKLYQIAVGIARGVEYLHRGCNTRILHFDIKPHNILLDQDFCPKISDFGLAKLCTKKESIISLIGARGTIGYIAPELVSRNFGGVSHKSDVYSYGMMLMEMVGGRKNANIGVSRTSEIYYPSWAYQRMVLDEDLKLQGIITQEEDEIARKMVLVGLWCIQTDPSQRPAISKVIEMLEGNLQALEIPPKPFFSSPSTSSLDGSSTIIQL